METTAAPAPGVVRAPIPAQRVAQRVPVSAAEALHLLAVEPTLLRLVVQPIVDLASAEVAGYEALARVPADWEVAPDALFAAADASGMGPWLTLAMLHQALELRDQLPDRCFLTVNCTPCTLAEPGVRRWLGEADLTRVVVEITESAWPEDEETFLAAVDLVRARGGMVAADDVGSGYAGLLQLVRLRPQMIKVDRTLVSMLETDPAAQAVIAMLGELASVLDAWLVVEGVETGDQLSLLAAMGVPLVQGYLLGKPADPWPTVRSLDEVGRRQLASTFAEHVAAHLREPRPGEVALDPRSRPLAVRLATDEHPDPLNVPAMTMAPSTTLTVALERALSRSDPLERYAPVCVTATTGELLGLVSVDQLARAALAQRAPDCG